MAHQYRATVKWKRDGSAFTDQRQDNGVKSVAVGQHREQR